MASPIFKLLPIFSFLRPSILDLEGLQAAGTGQKTDGRTENGHQSTMIPPYEGGGIIKSIYYRPE